MKPLEAYITESLYNHLNIEYGIFENAGLYDGIEELCSFLVNKIKAKQKDKKFIISFNSDDAQLSKMKNIFFKTIVLKCTRTAALSLSGETSGECVINDESDYDPIENKFNCIEIRLTLPIKTSNAYKNNLFKTLLHELTHAWDNFNHVKRYSTSLKTINVDRYNKIIDAVLSNGSYSTKTLGQILYFTDPVEVNAMLAGLAGYLYTNVQSNTINDPHAALKIIKSSNLYKNYVTIGEIIDDIYNKTVDNEFMHSLCEEYNKIYGTNFTEDKIRKQLYIQYRKVRNRIESNIGKICTKYIKTFVLR